MLLALTSGQKIWLAIIAFLVVLLAIHWFFMWRDISEMEEQERQANLMRELQRYREES